MLEDALFESQPRKKTRNPITVVVSVGAHVVTIAVLVLIPLLQTQALTLPPIDVSLLLPRIERPQSVPVFSARPQAQKYTRTPSNAFTAPVAVPQQITYVDEPPRVDTPVLPSGDGAGVSRFLPVLSGPVEVAAPVQPPSPPPQPPPPAVERVQVIRQSGGVQAALLIYQVKPQYPTLARQSRTQGVVVLEAVISKEGLIDTLRVISGHPLLTQSALDAVKQWKYRPTTLSGDPVDVITTVTVTFTLQ